MNASRRGRGVEAGARPGRGHRRRAGAAVPLAVLAVTAAATGTVAAIDPARADVPVCPFLALTGLECPACGGLRAVHALTHGDLGAALAHNALVVAAIPPAVALAMWWLGRALRPGTSDEASPMTHVPADVTARQP